MESVVVGNESRRVDRDALRETPSRDDDLAFRTFARGQCFDGEPDVVLDRRRKAGGEVERITEDGIAVAQNDMHALRDRRAGRPNRASYRERAIRASGRRWCG